MSATQVLQKIPVVVLEQQREQLTELARDTRLETAAAASKVLERLPPSRIRPATGSHNEDDLQVESLDNVRSFSFHQGPPLSTGNPITRTWMDACPLFDPAQDEGQGLPMPAVSPMEQQKARLRNLGLQDSDAAATGAKELLQRVLTDSHTAPSGHVMNPLPPVRAPSHLLPMDPPSMEPGSPTTDSKRLPAKGWV